MKQRLWFAYFSILLCWMCASYAELGRQWLTGKLLVSGEAKSLIIMDFFVHESVATLAHESIKTRASIYSAEEQLAATNKELAPLSIDAPIFAPYPPSFFLVMLPFTFLPMQYAYLCWLVTALPLVIWAMYYAACREFDSWFPRICFVVAVLASAPTWLTMRMGNPSAWLLCGITIFWIMLEKKQPIKAGLGAIVSLIKIQYLPITLLVGTILGGRRYAITLVSCGAIFFVLCVLLFGMDNVLSYPHGVQIGDADQTVGVHKHLFANIRGQLYLLTRSETHYTKLFCYGISLVGTLAVSAMWYVFTTQRKILMNADPSILKNKFRLLASITILASTILSVHTYQTDYVLPALPCLWLWKWNASDECALSKTKKTALAALILSYPFLSWTVICFPEFYQFVLRTQPYALWSEFVIMLATEGLVRDYQSRPMRPKFAS